MRCIQLALFSLLLVSVAFGDAQKPAQIVGETLGYKIHWGFVSVAKSTTTSSWIEEDDEELISIVTRTKSNNYLEKLYPVDDWLETIIHPKTLLPRRFSKRLNEGRYHCDEMTFFNHDEKKAFFNRFDRGRMMTYPVEEETRDLVSFMYSLRNIEFPENSQLEYQVMADEKVYDLIINTYEVETVNTGRWGKIPCIRVVPEAKFEGIFVRKGKVEIWVSRDERRVMTKMLVDTPFANVKLTLDEVSGGPEDFWLVNKKGD